MGLTRFTRDRPLVLWTDFAPDFAGGGAVILRSLLDPEDRARIVWASPSIDRPGEGLAPLRSGSRGGGAQRSILADSTLHARALADETLRVAQDRGERAIWILLHGAGVPVAAEIARRGTLPMHATVHDDPPFAVAIRSRRYLAITPWIERQLGRALAGARSIDVISDRMVQRYRRRFGVSSFVVHRALPGPVPPSPPYDLAAKGLRVGLMGNPYTYDQLPVLGRAVAGAARALGVRGRLVLLGAGFQERLNAELAGSGVEIEAMGHVDEGEGVRLLSDCFACYLNYPFTMRESVLRRTSFPTKLSTYALAARPIVTHAPPDGTLARLSSHAGYVFPWTTMSAADGEAILVGMGRERALAGSAHVAAEAIRARYFDLERNRRAITSALDALVPPLDAPAPSDDAPLATSPR